VTSRIVDTSTNAHKTKGNDVTVMEGSPLHTQVEEGTERASTALHKPRPIDWFWLPITIGQQKKNAGKRNGLVGRVWVMLCSHASKGLLVVSRWGDGGEEEEGEDRIRKY